MELATKRCRDLALEREDPGFDRATVIAASSADTDNDNESNNDAHANVVPRARAPVTAADEGSYPSSIVGAVAPMGAVNGSLDIVVGKGADNGCVDVAISTLDVDVDGGASAAVRGGRGP